MIFVCADIPHRETQVTTRQLANVVHLHNCYKHVRHPFRCHRRVNAHVHTHGQERTFRLAATLSI